MTQRLLDFTRTAAAAGGMVSLLMAVACGDETVDGAEASLTPALEAAVDGSVVPAVERFADGAQALQSSVDALCEAPTAEAVTALQDEWLQLSRDWNRAGIYFIGPLADDIITPSIIFIESMRQRGTDYTATVRETLQAALDDGTTLDEAYFSGLTFNRVGMLALEVLLFENSPSDTPSSEAEAIAQSFVDVPRRCVYLQGMAGLLATRAEGVRTGWTQAHLETGTPFRDLLVQDMLAEGSDPTTAMLITVISHIEYLRVRKLDGILDMEVAGAARPELEPFYTNLASALDGVEEFMQPPGEVSGFFAVMQTRGFGEDLATVRAALQTARSAVAAGDREGAKEAFLALETSFRREVPRGLGVELGLTFTDGD